MHRFFTRWRKQELIGEFHDRLRAAMREAVGRDVEPTAGVVDSQSAKGTSTVEAAISGYDGGKKIKGRKGHIVVDSLGLILAVMVTPASTQDRDAAQDLLAQVAARHHRLRRVWADSGYTGMLVGWWVGGLVRDRAEPDTDRHPPQRRPEGLRGSAQAVARGADLRLAHLLPARGPRLREAARVLGSDDPVVDDHGHDPLSRPSPQANRPGIGSCAHPRATSRLSLHRMPS
ncbi:transposase, partial [Streptomyces sp. NPDC054775]